VILRRQQERERTKRYHELKAEGAEYDALRAELDAIQAPKPMSDFLYGAFGHFKEAHPWVGDRDVHPQGDRPRDGRGLLRLQRVREAPPTAAQRGRAAALSVTALQDARPEHPGRREDRRGLGPDRLLPHHPRRTDTSLLEEWESLIDPSLRGARKQVHEIVEAKWLRDLATDSRILAARLRTEMHLIVKALAGRDWEDAAELVAQDPDDPWDAKRFEESMDRTSRSTRRCSRRRRLGGTSTRRSRSRRARVEGRADPRRSSGRRAVGDRGEVDLRHAVAVESRWLRPQADRRRINAP
jgi:hypothetical protein